MVVAFALYVRFDCPSLRSNPLRAPIGVQAGDQLRYGVDVIFNEAIKINVI